MTFRHQIISLGNGIRLISRYSLSEKSWLVRFFSLFNSHLFFFPNEVDVGFLWLRNAFALRATDTIK